MATGEFLRDEIIASVLERASRNGGFVTRADLSFVPVSVGDPRRVIDRARGIWNPRDMDATLSVLSSADGPYTDREVAGGLFHYSYREGSINGDNAKLRKAYELQRPIILLRKVRDGVFVPIAPVYVVDDLVDKREFLLALDERVRFLANSPDSPERRYAERLVKQRLHQAEFRGRVIAAYSTRCAICRLRHGELLDAAHIIADRDEDGLPEVPNGLSLCKIHHAAFDGYLIGISPDYQVRVDRQLLEETDGPMLRYGLQGMHGVRLTLPEQRRDRPDADRLNQRYAEFLRRAS